MTESAGIDSGVEPDACSNLSDACLQEIVIFLTTINCYNYVLKVINNNMYHAIIIYMLCR